jgi:glycine/D-amino acid oxidase-like deaminating enzyme
MSDLPKSVKYTIVGAGVHGLSAAWHLAMELEARGRGSGQDIVVLDKSGPGAGASGIACGCVRNFYMTEPIHALLRHSVDVWTHDPIAFGFQQVGYVSVGEENQVSDYERIHKSQNAVGYHSELYVGQDARRYLKNIWPDFNTADVNVALFERVSGYAGTAQVMKGLVQKCSEHGVRVIGGVEVLDYNIQAGQVKSLVTNQGEINTDLVIWGLGAWTPKHWGMLGQPMTLECSYPDGSVVKNKDMWTYWRLLEGEVYYDQPYLTADGLNPPVLHVELMNTPVKDETTGEQLKDYTYVYYKNGNERMDKAGLQGGTIPIKIGPEAIVDPYANDEYQAGQEFADYLCAAMAQTMTRFQGIRPNFRERRNGGIGAFTPDNVPIIDWVTPNVYMIADSNHGFKMLGAGKLAAKYLMGDDVSDLKPFAFSRFAEGQTFGSTNSHSPWV